MISYLVFVFIILPIVTEAITEIIGVSTLFKPVRDLVKKPSILVELLQCKYCMSVWTAFVLVILTMCVLDIEYNVGNFFCAMLLTFLIHRLANLYHLVFDIVENYKRYRWSITVAPPLGGTYT